MNLANLPPFAILFSIFACGAIVQPTTPESTLKTLNEYECVYVEFYEEHAIAVHWHMNVEGECKPTDVNLR